jgi:hypothetical protein
MGLKKIIRQHNKKYDDDLFIFWEGRRRNQQYKQDFEKYVSKEIDEGEFLSQWRMFPVDPQYNLNELISQCGYHTRPFKGSKRKPFTIEETLQPFDVLSIIRLDPIKLAIKRKEINLKLSFANHTRENIHKDLDLLLDQLQIDHATRGVDKSVWQRRYMVWDEREKNREKPYKEIIKELSFPSGTAISKRIDLCRKDFAFAYEQIYGRKYEPIILRQELRNKGISLDETGGDCNKCMNKECLKTGDVCPEKLRYADQDYVSLKESFIDEFDEISDTIHGKKTVRHFLPER